jgi:hypothetical protein
MEKKYKLIDLNWIDRKLKLIEEADKKLGESWNSSVDQIIEGGVNSGIKLAFQALKEELISPEGEIKKAFGEGWDSNDEGQIYKTYEEALIDFLKNNGYESDNI